MIEPQFCDLFQCRFGPAVLQRRPQAQALDGETEVTTFLRLCREAVEDGCPFVESLLRGVRESRHHREENRFEAVRIFSIRRMTLRDELFCGFQFPRHAFDEAVSKR